MATSQTHVELLGKVPLFQGLSEDELEVLLRSTSETDFQAGTDVVREGDKGAGFHLILSGTATVTKGGQTLRSLGPGESFGDIALIDDGHRTATVHADAPLHTLSITTWNFKPVLLEHPQIAYKLLVELCRRLREAEARAAI